VHFIYYNTSVLEQNDIVRLMATDSRSSHQILVQESCIWYWYKKSSEGLDSDGGDTVAALITLLMVNRPDSVQLE